MHPGQELELAKWLMSVSKLHATVFWDKARSEWAVVDMGSKHGTFVQPAQRPDSAPVRLSPPRMASIPRPLHHLDRLIVGSTTFLCHIHDDRMPCAECTSAGQGVIPLFAALRESSCTAEKRPSDAAGMAHTQDAKKALTSLKRTLLARHDPHFESPSRSTRSASYIDRSARRRAMHPGSPFDSPGVQSSRSNSPGPARASHEPPRTEARPPGPLAEDNVGWQLLMKQGWQPGTLLGSADGEGSGLAEPLEVHPGAHRAGLGMPQEAVQTIQEWRDDGKWRMWTRLEREGM